MGRITLSFRTIFQKELKNLRSFRDALMDLSRREALDSLKKAWSSEMGAMSYVKIPAVLDIMLLTAVVDNRKLILKLLERIGVLRSKVEKMESLLESRVS